MPSTMSAAQRVEMGERIRDTQKIGNRLGKLSVTDPQQALREAEAVVDPSMKASVLIAIAKNTRAIEPLVDAREIILGVSDMPGMTKNDKLTQVAFVAVGLDNTFAADTAREIPGHTTYGIQLRNKLSIALIPSLKEKIEQDDYHDFNAYPEFVMGSFHASVGNSNYFGKAGQYNYVRMPNIGLQTEATFTPGLDPIRDGGRTLDAFRNNPPYFTEMMGFIAEAAGLKA